MCNFFLLNEAINIYDINKFKSGMTELAVIEREDEDNFAKNDGFWNLPILTEFYSNLGGQEEQVIYKFIEQLITINNKIETLESLNDLYPNSCNAFMGIVFDKLDIEKILQIVNDPTYKKFKSNYYKTIKVNGDKEKLIKTLQYLYPTHFFESTAIDDILYWNLVDHDLFCRAIELIDDIENNPFTGGLGKTEVLKSQSGVASKRLDGEHRITYSLKNDKTTILACKGHYT